MTEFGKFLRILRIQRNENAQAMAKRLDMSPSYLSTIENGKRNIPTSLEEDIIRLYALSELEQKELRGAIVRSSGMVKIDFKELPENKRQLILEIAKGNVDEATLEKMRNALEEYQKSVASAVRSAEAQNKKTSKDTGVTVEKSKTALAK
jgi:transcriptional regulator with XRE-family HTH domain